jgi:hypothetical protein
LEYADGPIEDLNRWCRCVAVDPALLRRALEASSANAGLLASIHEHQPHLFSATAVFVSRAQAAHMRKVVEAIESVVALPAWQEVVLARAPAIARIDHGPHGGIFGYDFHVAPDGPKLIEINTNAGGLLLNTALAAAELACCEEVAGLLAGPVGIGLPAGATGAGGAAPTDHGDDAEVARRAAEAVEHDVIGMFRDEFRLARGDRPLGRVAIVDDDPAGQYLHPEFLLYRALFAAAGIEAVIADPSELAHESGALWLNGAPVDLVYNRLTDFDLSEPRHASLRSAYESGDTVLTPHPRAYALRADKRNLALLSDDAQLRDIGVDDATRATLLRAVPTTRIVDPSLAAQWWSERKRWFFKPVAGFGGRAAYRGDKLTRGVFESILGGAYVAQAIVPPSERTIERDGALVPLKLDLRNYTWNRRIELVAARLYQGQTTNFRTPGGGFAPVFGERARD